MKWEISYYREKVRDWIDNMPIGMRAYYARITERITERIVKFGPNLGMPFTRMIENGLFELRIRGKEGISRVFYCTVKQSKIVMPHGFIKKSQKPSKKELKVARKRLNEVKQ